MNLVGKIFIVMILVMSLVFMSMAMAVYATHRNYQVLVEQTGKQLNDAKVVNKELTEERDKLRKDIDTIIASNRQSLTKVKNQPRQVEKDRTQLEREKADLEEGEAGFCGHHECHARRHRLPHGGLKSGGPRSTRLGRIAISTSSAWSKPPTN